jgi:hypothetical protein
MGRRGREKVQRTYSLQANAPLLIQALRQPEGRTGSL